MSVRDQERGATGVGRFLLRALVIAGGAVAVTAAAWTVASATAGADTVVPHDVIGSDAAGSLADAVLPAADSAPPTAGAGRIGGVVHDVTQPVRRLLASAGQARLPQSSHHFLGHALAPHGVLAETGKRFLGTVIASATSQPAAETTSASADRPAAGDEPAARGDVATAAALDDRGGAGRIMGSPGHFSPASAGPAGAWSAQGIGRGSGDGNGEFPPPSLPVSGFGSTAMMLTAHGGNGAWGATFPGCMVHHQAIGETRRHASHRAVADTACQPGVTPD